MNDSRSKAPGQGTIDIVCHKGANERAPENTFAAAQLCVDWGVEYVEIDVWTSRDGVFYLMHDATVDRTTDGSGYVLALTSEELDRLDAGSWFDPQFAGERVPRLDSFLRWIKGKAKVFFDVKFAHPQQLIDLIVATEMENDCFLWSGSQRLMALFRRLAPELSLKANVESVEEVLEAERTFGADIVEVRLEHMGEALMDVCHERGIEVMAYPIENDAEAYRQVLEWAPDKVNLDRADLFIQIREEWRS